MLRWHCSWWNMGHRWTVQTRTSAQPYIELSVVHLVVAPPLFMLPLPSLPLSLPSPPSPCPPLPPFVFPCPPLPPLLPPLQVANGHEECVEALLNARADPTLSDKQGCTPVHFASACGHSGILERLLQYGGSASTPDKHGYTPIHKAAYNGHDKCLEVLLEASAISGWSWGVRGCGYES